MRRDATDVYTKFSSLTASTYVLWSVFCNKWEHYFRRFGQKVAPFHMHDLDVSGNVHENIIKYVTYVTYGITKHFQHWFGVDFFFVRFCGIHLREQSCGDHPAIILYKEFKSITFEIIVHISIVTRVLMSSLIWYILGKRKYNTRSGDWRGGGANKRW